MTYSIATTVGLSHHHNTPTLWGIYREGVLGVSRL